MLKMETDKIDDSSNNQYPMTVLQPYDTARKKEIIAERETCLKMFDKWNETDQVEFVEILQARICHYQHGHINSYLKPMLQRDFISLLPKKGLDHVAENILSYLDADSLKNAEMVCKEWHRVISEGMLWKKLIERKVRTDTLWRGLAERTQWIQYLFKPRPGEHHRPHAFYRSLYPRIIKDIETIESNWQCTKVLTGHTSDEENRQLEIPKTSSRSRRKPKVVFTMMKSPELESQIKQLGGTVVDSVDTCNVLITNFVKRTKKLLSAVGLGKPICTEAWVLQSKKKNNFLDPWDFVLADREAEKKWDFSLKTSLERSSKTKLFYGYKFHLMVTSAQDVLEGAIESCGGKIVARTPKVVKNFVVVSSLDQKDKYKKLPDLMIVESEGIFDAVLRQEIRFERYLLK